MQRRWVLWLSLVWLWEPGGLARSSPWLLAVGGYKGVPSPLWGAPLLEGTWLAV